MRKNIFNDKFYHAFISTQYVATGMRILATASLLEYSFGGKTIPSWKLFHSHGKDIGMNTLKMDHLLF